MILMNNVEWNFIVAGTGTMRLSKKYSVDDLISEKKKCEMFFFFFLFCLSKKISSNEFTTRKNFCFIFFFFIIFSLFLVCKIHDQMKNIRWTIGKYFCACPDANLFKTYIIIS